MDYPVSQQAPTMEQIATVIYKGHEGKELVPSLIGTWLACVGQGAVTMQFWWWCKHSSRTDPLGTRAMVYFGMLVVTVETIFLFVRGVYQDVLGYGFYTHFFQAEWGLPLYLFILLARIPTQAYLIHRTWILSSSVTILVINILLSLGFVSAQVWDYVELQTRALTAPVNPTPSFVWGAFEVAGSAFVSGTMMYYFLRSRTGWQSTDKLLKKLTLLVVQTQLPPTLIAITFIALTIANIPNGPSPYGFLFLCEPHILIISILILLNSRQKMSEVRSESSEETRIRTPPSFPLQRFNKSTLGAGNIHVTTETTWKDDEGRSILPPRNQGAA